ncbi:TetR/AcrR family transcriptional regulator [Streptomyces asiaticus]
MDASTVGATSVTRSGWITAETPGTATMRSDTERNRRHLIKAAARLFENSPTPVSLAEIAKHAEVPTATAYRHFSSVEEVLHAFRAQVGSELRDFSAAPRRSSASETWATRPCICGTRCSTRGTSSTSSRADEPRTRPPPASWAHCAEP